MKNLFTFFGVLITSFLTAQAPELLWVESYGSGLNGSAGNCMVQTYEGELVMAGYQWTAPSMLSARLIKTNLQGDTIWNKLLPNYSEAMHVEQTTDSGFILCGYFFNNAYLVRLNNEGDTLWTRTFNLPYANSGAGGVCQTDDKGFLLAGSIVEYGVSSMCYFVKTDSLGNLQWTQKHGGGQDDGSVDVKTLSTGGYIAVGSTRSFGAGEADVFLIKMDENGDTVWTAAYGGDQDDWGVSVRELADGGFAIVGNTRSFHSYPGWQYADGYLIRTDSLGDTLWTRTFNLVEYNENYINTFQPVSDSEFILVGNVLDLIWLLKVNDSGDTIWTATYDIGTNESATSIINTGENEYYITGGVKYGPSASPPNFYLMKLGNTVGIPNEGLPVQTEKDLLVNYPNPFYGLEEIEVNMIRGERVELTVFTLDGKKISVLWNDYLDKGKHVFNWDGSKMKSGIYLICLRTANDKIVEKALLVR